MQIQGENKEIFYYLILFIMAELYTKKALYLFFCLFLGIHSAIAQTTLSTTATFLNNNGTGTATFNFQNTNGFPIVITDVEGVVGAAGVTPVEFWYKNTALAGAPGAISVGNGWTQVAAGSITGIANATTTVTQPFFTGLSFTIPAGVTYAFAVYGLNQRYYTHPAGTSTTSAGGCNLITGTNIGYAGGTPPAAPTFTPRGWIGKLTFAPAGPCVNPPTPGTVTTVSNMVCPNTNFTLSLAGGTGGTGQTYQWQSSPNNSTWTPIGGATNSSYTGTQLTSTYYRCQVTCGVTVASASQLITTNGTPLAGTYTINGGLPTGGTNYQTFTDLAIDLNCAGVSAPVVVNVIPATYTEQINIGNIPGSSLTNTVTINGSGSTLTFAAIITAPHTLMLSGADYMSWNNMSIVGTGATYALACHLWNQSDNNTFNTCTFTVPANGTSTTQVPFSLSGSATSATLAGTSGNNNLVNACTLNSGYYNLCMVGSPTIVNTGNRVIGCNLLDFYFYGSYNLYQNGLIIAQNIIERPTRTTLTTCYGVYLSTGCVGTLVEKNRIRNTCGAVPNSAAAAYGIYCLVDGTVGNENRIYNNLISGIVSAGIIGGIYAPGADYIKIYHNTISLDDVSSTATGATYGIFSTGNVGGMDFKDNLISITRGGTGTKYGLYYSTLLPLSNFNDIYINAAAGTNYVGYYSVPATGYTTLAAWQAANGSIWDQQSVSVAPVFQSPATNDFTPTSVTLNNVGTFVGVTTDILGTTRGPSPDVGCYEFSVFALDAGAFALIAPAVGNGCYSATEPITIQIKNYGSTTLNFSTNPATITCNITGPVNSTLTASPTGTVAPGAVMNVLLIGTADMSVNGTYTINATMSTSGDPNAANDAMTAASRTKVALTVGTITALPNSLCVSGNSTLALTGSVGANIQWQQSTISSTGPWTNVGTNATTYAATGVSQTTYYRAALSCNSPFSFTNIDSVTVNSPAILTTAPASICGIGSLTLGATSTAGSTVNWFAASTGGSPLATGNSFATPILNTTTSYWAAGVTGTGGTASVAMPAAGTNFVGNVRGYWFTAPTSFTITGLQDLGAAVGNQSIAIVKFNGNTPPPTFATVTNAFTVLYLTQSNANLGVIPVSIPINAGEVIGVLGQRGTTTSYSVATGAYTATINGMTTAFTRMGMQFPLSTTAPQDLWQEPASNIGRVQMTYQVGCESPRVAVIATITPGPAFTVIPNKLVCNNVITPLTVTSNVNDFNQYIWSPNTNLYTDASATIPYTGTNVVNGTVYHKSSAAGTNVIYCNAYNTSSTCANIDTVSMTTQPASVVTIGDSVCVSGPATINLFGTSVGLQWQQFSGSWTNIAGATTSTYITPSLSANTDYQVLIMNSLGANCFIQAVPVVVSNPQVLSTAPGSRCGVGPVVLGATSDPGSTLLWYNTPTPTSLPLGTGPSFTTPSIASTTNYYVLAASAANAAAPGSLFTTNAAGNGANGNLFDVQAVTTIRIDSFSIFATVANTTFSVYYRVGTGIGFNTSNAGWTLIGAGTIGTINPIPANLTRIPLNINVILNAGQTYSFAISTSATVSYTNGTTLGNLYVQDPNLKIYEGYGGTAVNPGFGFTNTPRVFNGRVYYTANLACSSAATLVTATVTPPPALTISGTTAAICANSPSSVINVTSSQGNYNTYSWFPATGVSGNVASGYTFNPSVSSTYVLTATQTSGAMCQDTAAVTITANPVPITPTITPNTSTICNGSIQSLVASGSNNTITAATGAGVLTTSATGVTPYSSFYEGSREQYLILATELNAMGFVGGNLTSLAFDVTALGTGLFAQSGFTIKLAHTANTTLASAYGTPIGSFSTVYGPVSQGVPNLGLNTYTFASPFAWNGTSNILVDICHDNDPTNTCALCYSTSSTVKYTTTAFNSVWGTYNDNAAACGVVAAVTITTPTTRPNMTFTQSLVGNYTWGPLGTLYTDPAATVAYLGTVTNTIYAKPTATATYTVTATGSNGCSSTSTGIVTVNPPAVANAGNGQTICYGSTANIAATSSGGANAGTWSGGLGNLGSPSMGNTTYTPALAESGSVVILTWTTNATGLCPPATDTVRIGVNAPSTSNAGSNSTICVTGVRILSAVSTPGTGTWSTPNGLGAFGSSSSANTIYTPNVADVAASPILLIWTTSAPVGPCSAKADTLDLTVTPVVTTNAGNGQTICYGTNANLGATFSGGASGGSWSGAGAGAFANANAANTAFIPNIVQSGTTLTLTWTTNATGACAAANDTVNISINSAATVNAGTDITACSLSAITLGGSIGGSATSATWSGTYAGTFSSLSNPTGTYTPNASEAGSTLTFTLTTNDPDGAGPCAAATDMVDISISNMVANAGLDVTFCGTGTTTLSATSTGGTGAIGYVWNNGATQGGSVSPASTTTYTVTATDANSCTTTDAVAVIINPGATVNAGTDITACSLSAITLGGSTGGSATSATWSGTYAGTFSSLSNPTGTYTPNASEAGSTLTFTLTTNDPDGAGPCAAATDMVDIAISNLVADAGTDVTFCGTGTTTLSATSTGGTGVIGYVWNNGATQGGSVSPASTTTYTVTATDANSCVATDAVAVIINPGATVNAGTNLSTCGLATLNLGGSFGGSASSTTWSGTYAGAFSSLSNPAGTYTPAITELGTTVTLTLTTDDPDGAGPCAAATDNVDIVIGGYATTLAPPVASATPWIADYEHTDVFAWTHYYDNAGTPTNYCDDYLVLSIQNANTGGNAIGHIGDPGFSVKVAGQGAYSLTNASTPYVTSGVNWYLMGRYWETTPITQPANDLNVKFYFTNADFNAVNAVSPYVSSSPTQMAFYKINNGVGGTPTYNPDPSLLHGGVPVASPFAYDGTGYWQYLNGATPSTANWAYSTLGTDHVAEYTIDRFSGGGGGGGTGNAGAFPVELLSFTGYNNGDANVLEWVTTKEMNNKEFVLLHSRDNISFEEVATVPTQAANGISTTPLTYSAIDADFGEKTYYRLKQVDIDGASRMYPTTVEVNVNNDLNTVVSLFPNPAKELLNVSITQAQGGKYKVEMYDAIGKLVSVHKVDLKGGNDILTIEVADLAQGTYIIMVKNADNGTVANTRFVKE